MVTRPHSSGPNPKYLRLVALTYKSSSDISQPTKFKDHKKGALQSSLAKSIGAYTADQAIMSLMLEVLTILVCVVHTLGASTTTTKCKPMVTIHEMVRHISAGSSESTCSSSLV